MLTEDSTINSLSFCLNELDTIQKMKNSIEFNIEEVSKNIEELNKKLSVSRDSKKFYSQAVDVIYDKSIGALKNTINTALKYTFYDCNLEVNLILEDKRGNKTLDLSLDDLDKDIYGLDPLEDDGQGPAIVIGNILKLYYILNLGSKVLFLDEKLAGISAAYAPRYFEFLKQLSDSKEVILALVTHDPRHMDHADETLLVANGNVSILEKTNE